MSDRIIAPAALARAKCRSRWSTWTRTPSIIHGTVDHLRACSHTSRWCFGLRYSGVGDASMINPSPASNSPCASFPSGVVRRAVSTPDCNNDEPHRHDAEVVAQKRRTPHGIQQAHGHHRQNECAHNESRHVLSISQLNALLVGVVAHNRRRITPQFSGAPAMICHGPLQLLASGTTPRCNGQS